MRDGWPHAEMGQNLIDDLRLIREGNDPALVGTPLGQSRRSTSDIGVVRGFEQVRMGYRFKRALGNSAFGTLPFFLFPGCATAVSICWNGRSTGNVLA